MSRLAFAKRVPVLCLALLAAILLLLLPGCAREPAETTTTAEALPARQETITTTQPLPARQETPAPQAPAAEPQVIREEAMLPSAWPDITFSSPPELGKKIEIIVTITQYAGFSGVLGSDYHGEMAFTWWNTRGAYSEMSVAAPTPPRQVLHGTDPTWEGRLLMDTDDASAPLQVRFPATFPREGIWQITTELNGPDWPRPTTGSITIAVEKGRAGIYGTEDFFADRLPWMKDYSNPPGGYPRTSPEYRVPSDKFPLTAELDMPHAPRLGQPATFIWTISAIREVPQAKAFTLFYRGNPGAVGSTRVSAETIPVAGDLAWEGTLRPNAPLTRTVTIRFPEPGDWAVFLQVQAPGANGNSTSLYLNVTEREGRWGWAESHERVPLPGEIPKEVIVERDGKTYVAVEVDGELEIMHELK